MIRLIRKKLEYYNLILLHPSVAIASIKSIKVSLGYTQKDHKLANLMLFEGQLTPSHKNTTNISLLVSDLGREMDGIMEMESIQDLIAHKYKLNRSIKN